VFLGIEAMDPDIQGFLWLASVVTFILAFVAWPATGKFTLVPLGLALFVFPFMWNSFAASR
jgi:hypothetical protein